MKNISPLLILTLFFFGCSNTNPANDNTKEILSTLQNEIDSLRKVQADKQNASKSQISTFLTFQENNAEEAMNFYISLFENSKINDIQRYGKGGPAKEGTILMATFELNGSRFACSDSYIKHEWNFTPGVSIFVECKSEEEISTLLESLAKDGNVLMPLDNYGFSTKFAFVEDRFGVSWQLNFD